MAKAMPSAAEVAARWQAGFANAGPKWAAGINSVTQAPGLAAAAASDRYLAGVNANVEKFKANVAGVTLQEWKTQSTTKGQARMASGAQAGQAKYQAKIGAVLTAIGQIRDSLPPRADVNTNIQRAATMALQLHQRAQQGW